MSILIISKCKKLYMFILINSGDRTSNLTIKNVTFANIKIGLENTILIQFGIFIYLQLKTPKANILKYVIK